MSELQDLKLLVDEITSLTAGLERQVDDAIEEQEAAEEKTAERDEAIESVINSLEDLLTLLGDDEEDVLTKNPKGFLDQIAMNILAIRDEVAAIE